MTESKRLCFVCLGNIVRSPLAQHMFSQLVKERGLDGRYIVESAGTGAWHVGEPPDERMRRVASRRGLQYTGRARQFQAADFDRFDKIIVMDNENRDALLRLARGPADEEKIVLLREYDPMGSPRAPVPDPYYGGMDGFEEVYQIVERSARGLLDALEAERAGKKEGS